MFDADPIATTAALPDLDWSDDDWDCDDWGTPTAEDIITASPFEDDPSTGNPIPMGG